MKRVNVFILVITIIGILVGCKSNPPDEDERHTYVTHDEIISSSIYRDDNIYIQGRLNSCYIKDYDDVPYIVGEIQESEDLKFIYIVGQFGIYSDEVLQKYVGKNVRMYGDFYGMENNIPTIKAERSDSLVLKTLGVQSKTFKLNDFASSIEYVTNEVDNKISEEKYVDVCNIIGTHKSAGVVDISDNNEITQYQYDGYDYTSWTIYTFIDELDDKMSYSIEENILNNYSSGDALTIYYCIDEKLKTHIIGYKESMVSFTLEEAKEEAYGFNTLFEKEYNADKYGTLNLSIEQDKSDRNIFYVVEANVNYRKDVVFVLAYLVDLYDATSQDYRLYINLNKTQGNVWYSSINGSQNVMSHELNGDFSFDDYPSWINLDYLQNNPEEYINVQQIYEPIFVDFFSEVLENTY